MLQFPPKVKRAIDLLEKMRRHERMAKKHQEQAALVLSQIGHALVDCEDEAQEKYHGWFEHWTRCNPQTQRVYDLALDRRLSEITHP